MAISYIFLSVAAMFALHLGTILVSHNNIGSRLSSTLLNSLPWERAANEKRLSHHVWVSLAYALVLGAWGVYAELTYGRDLLTAPMFAALREDDHAILINLYMVSSISMHLLIPTAVAVYCCYCRVLEVRVRSASRVIGHAICSVTHAQRRLVDIETIVDQLSECYSNPLLVIMFAMAGRFVLLTVFVVMQNPNSQYVMDVWSKGYFVFGMVVQPCLILVTILFTVGALSSECEFLKKVAIRYYIVQSSIKEERSLQVEYLLDYVRTAEIKPSLNGHEVDTMEGVQIVLSGIFFYTSMLKYKYRMLI